MALFAEACEQPADARAAFVAAACPTDPQVREDVLALVAAHEAAADFLQEPVVPPAIVAAEDEADDDGMEGRRIGPYQVLERIGDGGMGTVYLAVRADEQFTQRVAIKVVKHGVASPEIVRRFRQERQILASLDHEGIARLLDGGVTADGRPYLVMEHVQGLPIDRYCDERRLTITARLDLFRAVCAAVQFAHQNLVVHRDLKPSNVLISATGVPKLLDFGIAKLLNPELAPPTLLPTRQDVRLMTPEYASPEQVKNGPVTTASDVYSLGVLLYELLTGHLPYPVRGRPLHDVMRLICETEPARPSAIVERVVDEAAGDGEPRRLTPEAVSRTREGRVERLRRRLAGDLDTIVLKALKKEPQRRYGSVEQLSEDIHRHLSGRPIAARPDTAGYRAAKFLARHRGATAAAVLLLVSILAGLAATLSQAHRAERERALAERRFNEVRGLANSLLFDLHDAIARLPGSTAARQLLVERALVYLDRLGSDAGGDVAFQRELAAAYRRVGDVQGNPYRANLGEPAAALASYRRALAILEASSGHGDEPAHRRGLAETYEGIGDVQVITGDVAGGLVSQRRALALRLRLVQSAASTPADRGALANSHAKAGQAAYWAGRAADALAHQREALRLREALLDADPSSTETQFALVSSLTYVGEMLAATGDSGGAMDSYRRAEGLAQQVVAGRSDPRASRLLAIAHTKIGELLGSNGDHAAAAARHRQALRVRTAIAEADPQNAQARRDVAISQLMLAAASGLAGDLASQRAHLDAGLRIFEELAGRDAGNTLAQADVARAESMAGRMLFEAGRIDGAAAHFERAAAVAAAVVRADPTDVDTRRELATAYQGLGDVHLSRARARQRTAASRVPEWHTARGWFAKAHGLLDEMRRAGTARDGDAAELASLDRRIRECDGAGRTVDPATSGDAGPSASKR